MRRAITTLGLVGLLLMGSMTSASAAVQNWSGNVSSGGTFAHFSRARTSTMEVWVAVTSAEAKVQLITCDSRKANIGVTRRIATQGAAGMGSGTKNQKFCMAIARSVPADTNGWLAGPGITYMTGRIEY